jgi:ketosteroid isomerase-like protein
MTEEETRIRTLIGDWTSAVRAKDLDGAVANHSSDIVMFDVPLPIQSKGIGEYRKTWELFFEHNRGGPGSFEVTELQVVAGEDVAFAHAIFRIGDTQGRLTLGLRKEDGDWLIAHEHHSYPIDFKAE